MWNAYVNKKIISAKCCGLICGKKQMPLRGRVTLHRKTSDTTRCARIRDMKKIIACKNRQHKKKKRKRPIIVFHSSFPIFTSLCILHFAFFIFHSPLESYSFTFNSLPSPVVSHYSLMLSFCTLITLHFSFSGLHTFHFRFFSFHF